MIRNIRLNVESSSLPAPKLQPAKIKQTTQEQESPVFNTKSDQRRGLLLGFKHNSCPASLPDSPHPTTRVYLRNSLRKLFATDRENTNDDDEEKSLEEEDSIRSLEEEEEEDEEMILTKDMKLKTSETAFLRSRWEVMKTANTSACAMIRRFNSSFNNSKNIIYEHDTNDGKEEEEYDDEEFSTSSDLNSVEDELFAMHILCKELYLSCD